ncbi:MAG TPA: pyridoxamine 5'-phosphate oxidase family protein [Streptosporangiaceae bacterium]|nr:pyridoxamine 5'-phosphate oxidase family protein [Streptosporangiaceae bacterium]
MRWSEIERYQPGLAGLGRQRLLGPGVVLVVTIRRDGTPRLSPVEPFVLDGGLWLSMMWQSTKAADLLRDPRVLVHSVITSRDGGEGEFKVRGTARAEHDPDVQRRYARAVAQSLGWDPEVGRFHLFEIDAEHLTYIRYDPVAEYQHVAMWPPAREFTRQHDSATTLAAPQPAAEIIVPA